MHPLPHIDTSGEVTHLSPFTEFHQHLFGIPQLWLALPGTPVSAKRNPPLADS